MQSSTSPATAEEHKVAPAVDEGPTVDANDDADANDACASSPSSAVCSAMSEAPSPQTAETEEEDEDEDEEESEPDLLTQLEMSKQRETELWVLGFTLTVSWVSILPHGTGCRAHPHFRRLWQMDQGCPQNVFQSVCPHVPSFAALPTTDRVCCRSSRRTFLRAT